MGQELSCLAHILGKKVRINNNDECPICLEEFNNAIPVLELHCGHVFHIKCIDDWYQRSDLCPLCAQIMDN